MPQLKTHPNQLALARKLEQRPLEHSRRQLRLERVEGVLVRPRRPLVIDRAGADIDVKLGGAGGVEACIL